MSLIPYEVSLDNTEGTGGGGEGGDLNRGTGSRTSSGSTSGSGGNGTGTTSSSNGTSTSSASPSRSGTGNNSRTTNNNTDGITASSSRSTRLYFLNVSSGSTLNMAPGETIELHIRVQNPTMPQTVFESSDTSVAIVSKTYITTAKLMAKSPGTATIKVYFTGDDGVYYEDSFTLVVSSAGGESVISDDKKIWLAIGQRKEITITDKPTFTSAESSNPEIASFIKTSVDKAVITAKTPGVCVVKLNVKDASGSSYCSDAWYVIVTHGEGTNYLDIISFEKSTSWENLNLGSVFVVGCSEDETTGDKGAAFKSEVLSPESWRNLVNRSYKEVKIYRLGQDISINVTPGGYLEDLESEESWISQWTITPESEDEEVPEIFCKFVGLGVYKFIVQSNCPVRFKTNSNKISIGPWSGEARSEYVFSDYGNNKVLPIHILDLPEDSIEIIDITYESPDGRVSETVKAALYPPLPGLVDIRGPYIYIIPGDRSSYNQRIEVKSYGGVVYSGLEYPRERDTRFKTEEDLATMWTPNIGEAATNMGDIRINIASELYDSLRTDDIGLSKQYITLKSVTGYLPGDLPTAPVARIRFDIVDTEHTFTPINMVVKDHVYYYIYVLPEIPINNYDTYKDLEECPTDLKEITIGYSIFERYRTNDINATWPGTDIKFLDLAGMSPNFSARYEDNYANSPTRNSYAVTFYVKWTGSKYDWDNAAYGSEVGSLVINWYYNKDYILKHDGLFNYYYINNGDSGYGTMNPPYNPDNKFYTQTVHFIKFQKKDRILNRSALPTHYSAVGTYDPTTMNPGYKIIETDIPINQVTLVGGGYWKYVFREEEVDGIPVKFTCEQNPEDYHFLNFTVEPRGNNVSFGLDEWRELIPYYSMARGEIKFICESNVNHRKSDTILDTFSFTQDGLEDCILIKDKIYLGRSEINLPDVSYAAFTFGVGGYGIKSYRISDVVGYQGQLSKINAIPNGINVIVWKEGQAEAVYNETATSFDRIELPENEGETEITYTIEIIHNEDLSVGEGVFENRIIIKVKQRTKSSDVYVNENNLPDVYSYGGLTEGLILYTSIPKNKIVIEEVDEQDPSGRWMIKDGGVVGKPRIEAFNEAIRDPVPPAEYKCFRCFFSLTPNSSFLTSEDSSSYLGEDKVRKIRIRHLDIDEGEVYYLRQGYYTLYPTLMYKVGEEDQDLTVVTEKDSRDPEFIGRRIIYNKEEDFWQIGTQFNPVDLPPFRNAGSNLDMNKVWISLMALRHEVQDGNVVSWVNTTKLFEKGALEIEENYRKLFPDTVEYSDAVLSEGDWFRSIQTDLVIHSTDKTSENTWRVLRNIPGEDDEREDIEFPALETIYTASGAGFYERRVIVQENIELKLGVLTKKDDILYEGSKPYTVNSKIQIWYRKIGEDIKDE
jgi:hypothetical protein